jgi:uncharacterized protein
MSSINFFERFFPVKYDFYEMLNKQAELNSLGIKGLYKWLSTKSEEDKAELIRYVNEADEVRMDMETKLIDAFITPFDRADIYSISVAMDKIIEFARSTLQSIETFEVDSDEVIISMVERLKEGSNLLFQSIKDLKNNPHKAQENIASIRAIHVEVEKLYRSGLSVLFNCDSPMYAIKYREVYHHIKDASLNLEYSVDIFHKIVVRRI